MRRFLLALCASLASCAATFSWVPPTQYTDGSAIQSGELLSTVLYCGAQSGPYSVLAEILMPATSATLAPNGTHCVVTARTDRLNDGTLEESAFSNEVLAQAGPDTQQPISLGVTLTPHGTTGSPMARPIVTASAVTSTNAAATTIAPTLAAHSTGDLLLIIATQARALDSHALTISGGSGAWTALGTAVQVMASRGSLQARAFARVAASGSESSPTITGDPGTSDGAERQWIAHALTITGAGDIGDFLLGSFSDAMADDTTGTLAGATVDTADSIAIRSLAMENDNFNSGHTTPSGHTVLQAGNNTGAAPGMMMASASAAADPSSIAATDWVSIYTAAFEGEISLTVIVPPAAAVGAPGQPKIVGRAVQRAASW